ncbi:hypothetical protein B0A54_07931 [Friedmanniomyces endolithicus]|uniref:DRBM domain-containing protein n=1 Tax=Friedmanniomyces endolithicus TaxID=329885 RepID=A0A4U0UXT5_9PEZI|nr:hypothetical protein B0A54_07931 [Friedmanniomyces endolithicus]
MFYLHYLQSVCTRRHWPPPLYETSRDPHNAGWLCKVRVNNREYSTPTPYLHEFQAREGAATNAYMICRNFSHNDGMYPGQRPGQKDAKGGAVQGLPAPIGTGRRGKGGERERGREGSVGEGSGSEEGGGGGTSSSGGESPRSIGGAGEGGGFEQQMRQVEGRMPMLRGERAGRGEEWVCDCRRGPAVFSYGRCGVCSRENGWA